MFSKYHGELIKGKPLEFAPVWSGKKGCRLRVLFDIEKTTPLECAEAMLELIALTKDDVSQVYARLKDASL